MALFRYDPDIVERFPAVVGGVIHATGVHNRPTPARLAAAFHDETVATPKSRSLASPSRSSG